MKMSSFEKRFVNSVRHSRRVADRAEERLHAANPQPGEHLLDVGCGNGAAAIQLAQSLQLTVTGVDIDPEQIKTATAAAQNIPSAHFLSADATRLPFDDGQFDLVYTNKTTHHIRDWQQAFAEMARVLKPGGRLICSDFVAPVGNRLPTRRALERLANQHRLTSTGHSRTPLSYAAIFRKAQSPDQADSDRRGPSSTT